jgi:hypothetical protein
LLFLAKDQNKYDSCFETNASEIEKHDEVDCTKCDHLTQICIFIPIF